MPAVLTFAPIRGATEDEQQCYEALEFQPTCPVRGTTTGKGGDIYGDKISIHVPRTGHDGRSSSSLYALDVFQSTRPLRGATIVDGLRDDDKDKFQSTCPVRGTTMCPVRPAAQKKISIHVPRTGHDRKSLACLFTISNFNPRAPYGARPVKGFRDLLMQGFQSTCPVRGTTTACC